MYAAEHDVLALRLCCDFRKPIRIAAKIGETNHFVTLIVMSKNDEPRAQLAFSGGNAGVHGNVGEDKIIIETATCCCCCSHFSFRLQSRLSRNGDVESIHRLQQVHCKLRPTCGVVEADSLVRT
jgi:hypothetical protein